MLHIHAVLACRQGKMASVGQVHPPLQRINFFQLAFQIAVALVWVVPAPCTSRALVQQRIISTFGNLKGSIFGMFEEPLAWQELTLYI